MGWPRLSEELAGPRRPDRCQSCGSECDLDRWVEHDDDDTPEAIVVVLCLACSDRLIESHPRLYDDLHRNHPWPGCMGLCVNCRHRDGVRCDHPDLKANGGPGLGLVLPRPSVIFWDGTDESGNHVGKIETRYPEPCRECKGREAADVLVV